MTHTLAAVFETRAEATRARDELAAHGFDSGAIQISDSGSLAGRPRIDDDATVIDNIKNIFSQLLGREHADRSVYAEALNRGHVVLTIETASQQDAERAADIIDDFAPIDIDAHETMWRASGWTGADVLRSGVGMQQSTLSAQQLAVPEYHGIQQREEAVDYVRTEQLATTGSLQRGDVVAPNIAGLAPPISVEPTVQRSGMRIYPRDVATPNQDSLNILRGDDSSDDPAYFRSHWEKTYSFTGGTFQEYDPAYRHGESMAGNPGYKDKPWESAEPDVRSSWEATHPQSSWDKFKDAVRAGWERVSR
ncbi:MAG: hypothetical protein ABW202_01530 [Duganella sp.]